MSPERLIRIALLLAGGGLALVLAVRPVDNFDLAFHLRLGEHVLAHGIPTEDPFSWPGAGLPWALEQWLGPVVFHLVYAGSGISGLILFKAAVIGLAFLLVGLAARTSSGDPVLAALGTMIAVAAGAPRFVAQPYVFSLLGLAGVMVALAAFRARRDRLPLFALVPLFAVWPHLHPGYLTGLVALAGYGLGALVEQRLARDRGRGSLGVLGITVLACAAVSAGTMLAFHPLGAQVLARVLDIFSSEVARQHIVEYAPLYRSYPIDSPLSGIGTWCAIVALGLLPPLCWGFARVAGKRPIPWPYLAMWLLFAVQAFRVGRLIGEAAIVLAPAWAQAAASAREVLFERGSVRWLRAKLTSGRAVAALGLVLLMVSAGHFSEPAASTPEWPPAFYPRDCYGWIEGHPLPERVFNDLWFGGSFIFHFAPKRKTFIDGRSFYSERFFLEEYNPIKSAAPEWQERVRDRGIEWFLLRPDRFLGLHAGLQVDPQWSLVYRDPECVVYAKTEWAARTLGRSLTSPTGVGKAE